MYSAGELRKQVESALAKRYPSALSLRPHALPELVSCGLPEVDALLGGGLPLGAVTEITGAHSSGRTTLVLSALGRLTQQGECCAYIDLDDALDPISAAALEVDLRRLLWVRIREPRPREASGRKTRTSWTRMDHALRATDLVLNTGGFRAIVLDMGGAAAEQARRVPLATWYRFRLQAEKSRVLFLLITRVPCANSCAAVSLRSQQGSIVWERAAPQSPPLMTGVQYRVGVERSRAVDTSRKKPPASATAAWSSNAIWSR